MPILLVCFVFAAGLMTGNGYVWFRRPFGPHDRKGMVNVSNADLISVSENANTAFGGFDWTEHDGKGVRLFIQGFG